MTGWGGPALITVPCRTGPLTGLHATHTQQRSAQSRSTKRSRPAQGHFTLELSTFQTMGMDHALTSKKEPDGAPHGMTVSGSERAGDTMGDRSMNLRHRAAG